MKRLYAFDFDGTLTTKDTLLEFIKFAKGSCALYAAFALYLPLLVLMKLRLYSNYRTKEKIFSHLFRGMTVEDFNAVCRRFAGANGQRLLRPKAVE
ncbi:HAD family hydrolase, partial [Parabacteroides distasonis]